MATAPEPTAAQTDSANPDGEVAAAQLAPSRAENENSQFHLTLENFEGPLDLLLSLITRRQLDITEVALAQVTDEFIAHMRADTALASLSEFVVIAAILLDLKVASLLPNEVQDSEDLAVFEARDLLFARLLQYRAFKEVANSLREAQREEGKYHARKARLEGRLAAIKPPLKLAVSASDLAEYAAHAFTYVAPTVSIEHLHHPAVSVASQVAFLRERLATQRQLSFRELAAAAPDRATIVAMFLALLEMFKAGNVDLVQAQPLADLEIHARDLDEKEAEFAAAEFDAVAAAAVKEEKLSERRD